MTACINPNGMSQTVLQDSHVRKQQYVNAINYYLKNTPFQILFIENSGVDISFLYQDQISNDRMEVLTFDGNDYDKSLGKGYGEGLVIKFGIRHSKLLQDSSVIIKVSGRHIVKNINSIWQWSNKLTSSSRYVVCDVNRKTRGANSDLFIGSVDFFDTLLDNVKSIDESRSIWFEHILYESIDQFVKDGNEFQYLPLPLNQEGQSGSMGIAFQKPTLKMYGMNMVKAVLYKLGILKVR